MGYKELYGKYVKRLLDIVLSTLALIILSPLLGIIALLVRIKLGSPVIFKQARPGINETIFYLYKFRSMTNETGNDGRLLPDVKRLTKFGRFLRASSLDELLEFINILRGDMSIVGPRPLSIYYLPHYSASFRRRHDVRPGLTGLAQVNGRNNLQWDDRFEMDIKYVENISLLLDIKIILNTVLKVLKHTDTTIRGTTQVKDYGPYCIIQEEKNGGQQLINMTYSEIGSYFWLDGKEKKLPAGEINWLPFVADSAFTFSGRSAIEFALRDILKNRSIYCVFAPSYCCVSMLQSFIDKGIKVSYYEVGIKDGEFTYKFPEVDSHAIVLIMSYFGLNTASCHKEINKLHESNAVVIEDITHSLLCNTPACEESDYLVASLRKWFAIPTGGWVGKKQGQLAEKPSMDGNYAVEEKIAGMREKYKYLTGEINSKENFLLTNSTFENDLIHADCMLKIDDLSLSILKSMDIKSVIEKRRKNAATLLSGLMDLNGKGLLLSKVDLEKDSPLFIPIFMKTADRDELRKQLISKGIYCPIHWPEIMGAEVGLRANELSLICDQRYSEGDMNTIVDEIHVWFKNRA